jgi:adenylate kinase
VGDHKVVLLFTGPSGSGKGTQANLLKKELGNVPIITMGDLFRALAAEPTELGQRVKAILSAGELVPIGVWQDVLDDHLAKTDVSHGAILDGVLRSMENARAFTNIRAKHKLAEPIVINLEVPHDISVERLLKRGRHDDTKEMIEKRLAWSYAETRPVVDHFRREGRVIDINGDDTIEHVHEAIVAALIKRGIL